MFKCIISVMTTVFKCIMQTGISVMIRYGYIIHLCSVHEWSSQGQVILPAICRDKKYFSIWLMLIMNVNTKYMK